MRPLRGADRTLARLRAHARRAAGRDPNPLIRRADRVRSGLVLIGVLTVVALLALCWLPGLLVRDFENAETAQQAPHRHRISAVAVADSAPSDAPQPFSGTAGYETELGWTYPAGTPHRLLVETSDAQRAGTRTQLWVDDSGRPVPPPRTQSDITVDALWTSGSTLLAEAMLGVAAVTVGRAVLHRRAQRAWEREWAQVEPRWTGRAGRSA
ncbi:Rv1733c family protein [Phaeacidiphilus oryzae]|uniref:Rv1733c family protein n=1 Tax=Phaeacidiphilus oryzae TaxID=348818 RepID=UPI00068B86D8|nr:hypothetical protein [Phaeacidiphilus oryzae]